MNIDIFIYIYIYIYLCARRARAGSEKMEREPEHAVDDSISNGISRCLSPAVASSDGLHGTRVSSPRRSRTTSPTHVTVAT